MHVRTTIVFDSLPCQNSHAEETAGHRGNGVGTYGRIHVGRPKHFDLGLHVSFGLSMLPTDKIVCLIDLKGVYGGGRAGA